jgi:hypothetical protein
LGVFTTVGDSLKGLFDICINASIMSDIDLVSFCVAEITGFQLGRRDLLLLNIPVCSARVASLGASRDGNWTATGAFECDHVVNGSAEDAIV